MKSTIYFALKYTISFRKSSLKSIVLENVVFTHVESPCILFLCVQQHIKHETILFSIFFFFFILMYTAYTRLHGRLMFMVFFFLSLLHSTLNVYCRTIISKSIRQVFHDGVWFWSDILQIIMLGTRGACSLINPIKCQLKLTFSRVEIHWIERII